MVSPPRVSRGLATGDEPALAKSSSRITAIFCTQTGQVVGAHLAFYSERVIEGRTRAHLQPGGLVRRGRTSRERIAVATCVASPAGIYLHRPVTERECRAAQCPPGVLSTGHHDGTGAEPAVAHAVAGCTDCRLSGEIEGLLSGRDLGSTATMRQRRPPTTWSSSTVIGVAMWCSGETRAAASVCACSASILHVGAESVSVLRTAVIPISVAEASDTRHAGRDQGRSTPPDHVGHHFG